ncbi:CDP-alcohol phosphatidyltransferase [Ignisphaera aggregans DSM 17230]|uniref:Bifunctional IPC transferase and DIPP synthase n=1 Tax=Ignisphaera aggregans (strain DSM 17230 / JCM 13409 / AQ1.S1) TaxID=583356 RepID=E0SRX5_IGNAA|nr:CDP-alcohol phosphatidyltransferase [Ignisphaera aggregans DSM 17230]
MDRLVGVILAAGFATRLRNVLDGKPKALIELEPGVSIIDLTIRNFHDVGIRDIFVVTRKELVEQFYGKLPRERVLVVDVSEGDGNLWTFYNGYEKLVEMGIKSDFIVVMSDHIFERRMLEKLIEAYRESSDILLLCIDRRPRGRDVAEGLKIHADEDRVVEAGKGIPPISGIDTGLFIVPQSIGYAMKRVVGERGRKASFADLINFLASQGLVRGVDVTGFLWQDIDTVEDISYARRLYWRILKRNLVKDSDGVISRYLNRKISTAISIALYRNRIFVNPNIVTVVVAIIGVVGALMTMFIDRFIGSIMVIISSILDGVDGEIARLYNRTSFIGSILDHVLDRAVDSLYLVATYYIALSTSSIPQEILLILLATSFMGIFLVGYLSAVAERDIVIRVRKGFPPATRDVRITVLAICTILGYPELGLIYISIASLIFIAKIFIYTYSARKSVGMESRVVRKEKSIWPSTPVQPRILLEDFLYRLALAILTIYSTTELINILTEHRESIGIYSNVLIDTITVIGIILLIYFFIGIVKIIATYLYHIRNTIIVKIWIAPGVYERIVKEIIILAILLLLRILINIILTANRISGPIASLICLSLNVSTIAVLMFIAIEVIRALEHKIFRI